jgi:ABC-2 type transport system ATP-binding protein
MHNALVIDQVTKRFIKELEEENKERVNRSLDRLRQLLSCREMTTVTVVDNISITIKRGEIYGILGENGSGKSTLIRMISTLLTPDEGKITLFGHDVVKAPKDAQRLLNRVSVEASFFKKLSPLENLGYTARLYGIEAAEADQRIVEILSALNFDLHRLNDSMEDFSRGMQQKIAIARALMTTPVLLLLDEPTTGLDPRSKLDVQAFIRRIQKEHDTTILLTTHDMQEAEALCDRICILQNGQMLAEGSLEKLKTDCGVSGDGTLEEVFLTLTGCDYKREVDST